MKKAQFHLLKEACNIHRIAFIHKAMRLGTSVVIFEHLWVEIL